MGVWTHLAGVYDGAVARLYVNGAEVGEPGADRTLRRGHDAHIWEATATTRAAFPPSSFPAASTSSCCTPARSTSPRFGQLAAGALFAPGSRDAGPD